MTLTEQFIVDAIHIEPGAEVMYGSDQMNDCFPVRFATVEFELTATDALVSIADRIRLAKGYKPMHPIDGENVDNDGWYNFYIGINSFTDNHMDSCINFVVVNSDSEDNEDMYSIDLNESEQKIVYDILNRQCQQYHGKNCAELLAEAEAELNDGDLPELMRFSAVSDGNNEEM